MFYIYERIGTPAGSRAVIHWGSCGHCHDGTGKGEGYSVGRARWHGPYETLELAREASDALPDIGLRIECRCIQKAAAA